MDAAILGSPQSFTRCGDSGLEIADTYPNLQACADDPQVAVHAVRNLVRTGFGTTAVKWSQLGFGRTSSTSTAQATPRNLFGFKDGTNNLKAEDPDALRDETAKVMKAMRPFDADRLVRGQYEGYREEPGVSPHSDTETFVALTTEIDSWRWAGVPFSIRAGKALRTTLTEALVEFKRPPRPLFADATAKPEANVLRFRLTPDDVITLSVQAKLPGSRLVSRRVDLHAAKAPLERPAQFGVDQPEHPRGMPAAPQQADLLFLFSLHLSRT